MSKNELKALFNSLDFYPNKRLGQNFLLCNHIRKLFLTHGKIQNTDIILEVGPGFGFLTEELVKKAKQVIAIEIDKKLSSYLREKFTSVKNFSLITGDILKTEIPPYNKVIANIPYTITGPIMERLFYNENPPMGVITTETKIANRIFDFSSYKNLSRISVSLNSFMNPVFRKEIKTNCFYPQPKIGITLVKLEPKRSIPYFLRDDEQRKFYIKFIGGVFPYKNKNILNAINLFLKKENVNSINKQSINNKLTREFPNRVKLKDLTISELLNLCKLTYKLIPVK